MLASATATVSALRDVQPPLRHAGVFEPIARGVVTPFAAAPSATPTPVDLKLAAVRPFTFDHIGLLSGHASPYADTSKRYAQDLAEVQAVGESASAVDPADPKTDTVRFYTDPTFGSTAAR